MSEDNESSPFRRRHMPEVFTQRGTFSPISVSGRRSEIPINTLDYEPRDALFQSGCGCRRWFRRHSRCLTSFGTAVVIVTVLALLIASISVHFRRSFLNSHEHHYEKTTVSHHVNPPPSERTNPDPVEHIEEPDVDEGISAESLAPMDHGPEKERISAQILEDSRERYEVFQAPSIKHLTDQLSTAKLRYRRSLPVYNPFYTSEDLQNADSVRTKLDILLEDIREVRRKLQRYEMLTQYTRNPFYEYSLQYPVYYRPLTIVPAEEPIPQPELPVEEPITEVTFSPVEEATQPIFTPKVTLKPVEEPISDPTEEPTLKPVEKSTSSPYYKGTGVHNQGGKEKYYPDSDESPDLATTKIILPETTKQPSTSSEPSTPVATESVTSTTTSEPTTVTADEVTVRPPNMFMTVSDYDAYSSEEEETVTKKIKITWPPDYDIYSTEERIIYEPQKKVKKLKRPTTTAEVPTTTTEGTATTIEIPTTTTKIPTTAVEIPTTTIEIPTIKIEIPTTTVEIPTTTVEVPTTTIEIPTKTVEIPTITTTTAEIPTTTAGIPTTTTIPTTTVEIPTDSNDEMMSTFATTTDIPSTTAESGKKTLKDGGGDLEDEILQRSGDLVMAKHSNINDQIHGVSLEDARNRKLIDDSRKKWDSKVVSTGSDLKLPTGPDSTGTYEATKTGQQLSYSASSPSSSGYSHVIIPYQLCFYPNAKIQPRSLNIPSFNIPAFPGLPTSSTPNPSLPQQNYYNIILNNNNNPAPAPQHFPSYMSAPGFMSYPQQFPRQFNGQPPLFCSTLQSPFLQYPNVPGTGGGFSHSRCANCDEQLMSQVRAKNASEESFERENEDKMVCPEGMSRCHDDQFCIVSLQWCDGHVHCSDASDELHCSCKDRLSDGKLCDGYADCPNAEDETDCFDCPSTSFSCGTWDSSSSCIPLSQRCDGVGDCANGRDEAECSALSPNPLNFSDQVFFSEGFLLRNWRGTWYPVCSVSGRQTWAEEACSNSSPSGADLETENKDLPAGMKGPFITQRLDGDFVLERHCKGHVSLHVQCPPQQCGTRIKPQDKSAAFIPRFRRLIEQGEAPKSAMDRPFLAWWERLKEDVEKEFGVKNVVARLVPVEEGEVAAEGKRWKNVETADGKRGKRQEAGRVVGGRSSNADSWPWAVAMYRDGYFHCGAVLLDRDWVLTASHCIADFKDHFYQVRIGMLRRYSFSPSEEVRTISHVIGHEEYDKRTMKNDLALMKLSEPVRYGRWVRPTCLPIQDGVYTQNGTWGPEPGTYCVAIGWGAIKEHGMDPDHLREVELPILDRCKHREDVEGNEICAGLVQGGKDTCQGDSGGPLMCQETSGNRAWYVAGVVSHGNGCARPDEAGAYTRVSLFVDWLTKHTLGDLPSETPLTQCPGFQCSSQHGLCIPGNQQCNKRVNCLGGEDEQDCQHSSNREERAGVDATDLLSAAKPRMAKTIFNYTFTLPTPENFTCLEYQQSVLTAHRCDGFIDCQDASDELNCTCRDSLLRDQKHRICDGVSDCADGTDEDDCYKCPQFHCRKSRQCLVKEKRCDGYVDCAFGEDEDMCLVVVNDLTSLEYGEPKFTEQGWVVENQNGVWNWCVDQDLADLACERIGFGLEKSFVMSANESALISEKNCSMVFADCDTKEAILQTRVAGAKNVEFPWEVRVRVEGVFACAGVLVSEQWVLTDQRCLPNNGSSENYQITAEFDTTINPPRISIIDAVEHIANSKIILLHLEKPTEFSPTVRPIGISDYFSTPLDGWDIRNCFAMGRNTSVAVDVAKGDCGAAWCASRQRRPTRGCRSEPWTGVAVCQSAAGWIPVGLFREIGGACGFQTSAFEDIIPFFEQIDKIIGESPARRREVDECKDGGFRCLGGKCIDNFNVCDGTPHCEFGDDEKENACKTVTSTGCQRHEIACSKGKTKCIKKAWFLDGKLDCEDGSDEPPPGHTCFSYLFRANPKLLCDNIRNCPDKSDENYLFCQQPRAFSCAGSSRSIPTEFVCDGENDCLNGEDEENCTALKKTTRNPKEYEYRKMSYGLWHSICNESPSLEEADSLCSQLGHKKAADLVRRNKTGEEIVLDNFSTVVLNDKTSFLIRGQRPFASLKTSSVPCPITFVLCH